MIGLRRGLFDHLTGLSLRYFSQQKAGWIIARLTSDVDAVSDVLSQGMPTLVSNVILLPAAVVALLIADWRLGLVVIRRPAARARPVALVPTRLARRERRDAQPDRSRDRADRGVGGRHGDRAGVQPRAPRSRPQFDELNDANREPGDYSQKIFSIFFPSIEFLGVFATGLGALLRRRTCTSTGR